MTLDGSGRPVTAGRLSRIGGEGFEHGPEDVVGSPFGVDDGDLPRREESSDRFRMAHAVAAVGVLDVAAAEEAAEPGVLLVAVEGDGDLGFPRGLGPACRAAVRIRACLKSEVWVLGYGVVSVRGFAG